MKKFLAITFKVLLYTLALIGLTFTAVYFGMRMNLFTVRGSIAGRNAFFGKGPSVLNDGVAPCTDTHATCDWNGTPEWLAIKSGLEKDAPVINRVSTETGVPARMIAAVVVPEQTRFFTANREIFKSYFEPLKILGSLTQFSLGVSGIKQETAADIEKYAADTTSPFYPGKGMSDLLMYPTGTDHDTELYNRLTDTNDHYYQYLYTGIYLREIEAQWARAGYSAENNPEVLVTLFNLGFIHSYPKAVPQAAGAPITTGGKTYVYGQLGANFYHSRELIDIFPAE